MKTINTGSSVVWLSLFFIILFYIYLSPHNIKRITEWIQLEIDYNFINACYTTGFQDDQVILEQNDNELKQACSHCVLVPRYPFFFKFKHITCL